MQSSIGELSKYTPAYVPLSQRAPTEAEKRVDATLKTYMDVEMKLESDEEMIRRDSILAEVRNIFIKWVQTVATEVLHMPADEAEDAGGELFISGSHRLGVRDVGADIDTVCVAPNFCTREHFFTYLKDDLQSRAEVTNMIAIEEAFVPIISFDFRSVNIDLLFARLVGVICQYVIVIELHKTHTKYCLFIYIPYAKDQIWTFNLVYIYVIRGLVFLLNVCCFPFMPYGLSYIVYIVYL
jgi:poly(A) polymerase Pap1